MKTLDDARKWEAARPGDVRIQREVRYYAITPDVRYELFHDWTLEELERNIWMKEQNKCRKRNQ